MNLKKRIMIFMILAGILSCESANCQIQNEEPGQSEQTVGNQTVEALDIIYRAISQSKQLLSDKGQELNSTLNEDRKEMLLSEIKQLREKIDFLERDFERIASGVELDQFYAKPQLDFDLQKEVQDLLNPIIQELKNMTEKPRQLEKFRREIAVYENRIPVLGKAVANIDLLISETDHPDLKKYLEEVKALLTEKKQYNKNQLRLVKYQLFEKEKDKKSIFESTQHILQSFFKTRGRNLIISVVAFIAVFLFLRFLGNQMAKTPVLKKREKTSHYFRAVQIGYQFVIISGAVGASMIVLYVSGDWFLLSLVIVFLLGIAWTARQGISRFWHVIKLMLNLGTVRENERVIYHGLPWKVVSLNLFSVLENPAFQIGKIRIPIEELMDLISRPFDNKEPWFPCKIDDWVILADGTYGKVIVLTPEAVQLVLRGGSRKFYQIQGFLSQNPVNISSSFRIKVIFGIDYEHQAICTDAVPVKLRDRLKERLTDEGCADYLKNIKVEFHAAAASSLDYAVIADFSGAAADSYNRLNRLIQRLCVEACNEYGWIIPFTQITVHEASPSDSGSSQI